MCQENFEYRFEIQKQVPGTDQYVASHQLPKTYPGDADLGELILPLT